MEERDYMSEPLPCSFSSSCTRICNVLAMYCLCTAYIKIFQVSFTSRWSYSSQNPN
ncbi:hypothetical protein Peur_051449 [Populus x canadensis]